MRRARLAAAALLALGCAHEPARLGEVRAYRDLAGALAGADTTAAVARGRYALHAVRLTSSTGIVATGRLLRPTSGACHPAVLLQNGREENSAVIGRLPDEFGDVVVLALDYPDAMPMAIQLSDVVKHPDRLQTAAREIPARCVDVGEPDARVEESELRARPVTDRAQERSERALGSTENA